MVKHKAHRLDWELPGLRSEHLSALRRPDLAHCRIIAMSGQPQTQVEALAAGADSFISKVSPDELVLAVIYDVVGRGTPYDFGADQQRRLDKGPGTRSPICRNPELSTYLIPAGQNSTTL